MSVACTRCSREFANERARKAHSVWCGGPQNASPTPPTDVNLGPDLGAVLGPGPEWNDEDPPPPESLSTGAQALREQIEIEQARFQLRRIQIANKRLEDAERGPAPAPQPYDGLAAILQRQGDQIAQVLQALVQRDRPAAVDPMAQLTQLMQQMKMLRDLEAPAPGGGLAGLRDMVDIVKGILPPPAPGGGGDIKQLREIMSLGKELAGAAGEDDSVAGVLKSGFESIGKPLAEAWMESQQNKPIPVTAAYPHPTQLPQAQAPAPAGAAEIPPPNQLQENEMMDDTTRVRWFVATLLAAAARKEPPELWVDQVIYHVPDDAMAELLGGDPVPLLAKIDKRVTLQAEWFRALARAVKEALDADANTPGVDTGGT